jgi:hypothetical protein
VGKGEEARANTGFSPTQRDEVWPARGRPYGSKANATPTTGG